LLKFFGGSERIACAVYEQCRDVKIRKMFDAELVGLARGKERGGQKQEAISQVRVFGEQHRGLTAAVGMTSEKEAAGRHRPHDADGVS